MSSCKVWLAVAAAVVCMSSVSAQEAMVDQLILKYRPDVQSRLLATEVQARAIQSVLSSTGLQVRYKRAMSPAVGGHVLSLPYAMSLADAKAYAATVMVQHPELAYVEPDSRRYALRTTPVDEDIAKQWHLLSPEEHAGAANLVNAWDLTKGSAEVLVAVLDSGVTHHADLQANLVGGPAPKSGYDMVSDALDANDGNGRDADPSDPGAAVGAAGDSAWHGTHVAGLVAAVPDNGKAVAGVGWNTQLLAVRILSDTGGSLSDQVDGMLWAAGESVPGVPANTRPAQVLNLSLGTDSFEDCSRTEQDAVNALRQRGVSVVVAGGNENRNVQGSAPANCTGVVSVTGVMRDGARTAFANYGGLNDIAAPAHQIYSTYNTGSRAPEQDSVHAEDGTSQAAPQVAGVLALMLAANPALRDPNKIAVASLPALLEDKLKKSARPFPTQINGSDDPRGCNADQEIPCVCNTNTCGAGLLDAQRAVQAVSTAPIAQAGADASTKFAATVTLDGSASHDDAFGGQVAHYAWKQTEGNPVVLTGTDTAKASFTAPDTAQTLRFELTVTDDTGLAGRDEVVISVSATGGSTSGGGGGGSMDVWAWLLFPLFWGIRHYRRKL